MVLRNGRVKKRDICHPLLAYLNVSTCIYSTLLALSVSVFPCLTEIGRVRKDMYNDTVNGGMFNGRDMEELPEAIGPVAQLQEKLYVPVKEYPDVSGQIHDL